MHTLRARPLMYFAMGIAVSALAAWSLSAWQASAAVSADESTFVAVSPTRILDTREDIGLPGPFVSPVPQDLRVTGSIPTKSGTIVVVPDGATGVILNVTVVGPTADGFVSIRPADAPGVPTTSSLNFAAGDIIPNSVTVQMPTSGGDVGEIEITYDAFGNAGPTTEMLVDVVGYTKNAGLASLQTQVNVLQSRIDQFSQVDVSDVIFDGDPAGGALTGTYPSPSLNTNSVGPSQITTGAVQSGKIATDAVDGSKVLNGSLTDADLAANSVFTSKIGDGAVTGPKIASDSISATHLTDNSVGMNEIVTGAVSTDEVALDSLTEADLAPNSVGTSELIDKTVGLTEMNAIIGDDVLVPSGGPLGPGVCDAGIVRTAADDPDILGAAANSRVLVLLSQLLDDQIANPGWIAYGADEPALADTVRITVCNRTGAAAVRPAMTVSFIAIAP